MDDSEARIVTMSMPEDSRIRELDQSLSEHPGRAALDELNALDSSVRIFLENFRRFGRHLIDYQGDPSNAMIVIDMARRSDLERLFEETYRLLHNFLAAAFTLKEHTRTVRRRVVPGFREGYEREASRRFAADGAFLMCQGLRNYSTHWQPITLHYTAQGLPPTSTTVVMRRQDLLSWKNWPGPAKAWLRQGNDDIELLAISTEYYRKVLSFHSWFSDAVERTRQADIAEYREKEREYFTLWIETRLDKWLADPAMGEPPGDRGLFLRVFDISFPGGFATRGGWK